MTFQAVLTAAPLASDDRAGAIRDHLREAIVDRRLAPGTKLNEAPAHEAVLARRPQFGIFE